MLGSPSAGQGQMQVPPVHGPPAGMQRQRQQQQLPSPLLEELRRRLATRASPYNPMSIFEDSDQNGDARIDAAEFRRFAVRWLGHDVPAADLRALMSAIDYDGNGTISRQELAAALLPGR